ncbi:MAG: ABC transporter ATP-binding protein [Oscillospiraceae bacterium]|nr:ABC transporter ATP-binding protein [Oscillospiraceae bacterium]
MKKLRRTVDNILFLLRPALKYGKMLFILMLAGQAVPTVVNSLVGVATPKIAIDGIMNGLPAGKIIMNVALLILIQLAVSAAENLLSLGTSVKQNEFMLGFDKLIIQQAIRTDYRFLDKPEYFAKFQLTQQQFNSGSQSIFMSVVNLLSSLLTCAAMFAVIAMLGPWVVLIVAVGTFLQMFVNIKSVKISLAMSKEVIEKQRGINYGSRMLSERQYAADMKVSSMGGYVLGWLDKYIGWIKSILVRFIKPRMLLGIIGSVLNHATTLGVIAYVIWGISRGKIGSIGDYAALIAAGNTLSGQLRSFFTLITDISQTATQAEQAREFFDLPSVIEPSSGETPPKTPMSLELRNVSFAYPEADFCLKDINIKIAPGEKIGIVGENGAGKSTLAKLLLRLYDVDGGEILYDGKPISSWDVHELRKRVGIAFQDSNLYALTLRENLQYYNPEASDEARLKALKTVGLDRLDDLDKTVSREFMEDGIMLSGGETQKLALARLLMDDFGLMILDEPSSALDPLAEYKMTKLMFDVSNTTTVMIAHRLSTIRDADRIYLIADGAVAEQGTHAQLMAMKGRYAEMFEKQAENYVK